MEEIHFDVAAALNWFTEESTTPYRLVRINEDQADQLVEVLCDPIRRCYLSDAVLLQRADELEGEVPGDFQERQLVVLKSTLPDPGSVRSGEFGENLVLLFQAIDIHPEILVSPKKLRLKHDRNKPAPYSDIVQFFLPQWPNTGENDTVYCTESKLKSTEGEFDPISDSIAGCLQDRTGRLTKTLIWLEENLIKGKDIGEVSIAQVDRFLEPYDHPKCKKEYKAIAIISEDLLSEELINAPNEEPDNYQLVIIAVPNLYRIYNTIYDTIEETPIDGGK